MLVIDRDHVYAGEGQQILRAAAKFVHDSPPEDSVGLWTLPDSSTALRIGEDRDLGSGSAVRARTSFRVDVDAAAPVPTPEPVGVDPGDMADRLADYAERSERGMAAVVAEEKHVQVIHLWRDNPSGPNSEPGEKGKQGGPIIRGGRSRRTS